MYIYIYICPKVTRLAVLSSQHAIYYGYSRLQRVSLGSPLPRNNANPRSHASDGYDSPCWDFCRVRSTCLRSSEC